MKLNLAVVAGGYSSEKIVSLKSVETLLKFINKEKYNLFKVIIDEDGWFCHLNNEQIEINKTDFSFSEGDKKTKFDFAFITIHGTPGEDGRLQAYFDLVNVPYSTPSYLASTITSNKFVCNSFLKQNGFDCANSLIIRKNQKFDATFIVEKLGLPCFVKPSDGGSSFGVTKVSDKNQIDEAVELALKHGSEALIESFVKGVEVTCGVYTKDEKVYALPITEIVSENDFFDYEAKYQGKSTEITPARLSAEVTKKVQEATVRAYQCLALKGMSRIDFIVQDDVPFLIEVNTTPGLSEQSIIPQQVRHQGFNLTDFFDWCIQTSLKK
jgi:D-alanine-D-alanine ligase